MTKPLFDKTLKLYFFPDRKVISLSILSSSSHVITFYMNQNEFEQMIAQQKDGFTSDHYFVLRKKEYLRFSYSINQIAHHFRVDLIKWDQLTEDYQKQRLERPEELLTCIVP